jgi:hypothetical protein
MTVTHRTESVNETSAHIRIRVLYLLILGTNILY